MSRQSPHSLLVLFPRNSSRVTIGKCIREWLWYRKKGWPASTLRFMKALARWSYSPSISAFSFTVSCWSLRARTPWPRRPSYM